MKNSLRLSVVAILMAVFYFLAGCANGNDATEGNVVDGETAGVSENTKEDGNTADNGDGGASNGDSSESTEGNETEGNVSGVTDNESESSSINDDNGGNDGNGEGKVSFEGAVVTPTNLPETEPIDICSLSIDEMKDVLSSYSNFLISDNFYADIPQKAQLFNYITGYPLEEVDFQLAYNQFIDMFHYFFPEHDLDENYFFYSGIHSGLVKDHYDEIMAGEEADEDNGNIIFEYDEEFADGGRISFQMPAHFGYGYLWMGKGGTYKLSNGERIFYPGYVFPYIGTYYPISNESFQLQDKEVRISDAVKFFEDYVNAEDGENFNYYYVEHY